jgi:hypothetical protein
MGESVTTLPIGAAGGIRTDGVAAIITRGKKLFMHGMSLETANFLAHWGSMMLLLALALGTVSAGVVIAANRAQETAFLAYQGAVPAHVAAAQKSAFLAGEDAANKANAAHDAAARAAADQAVALADEAVAVQRAAALQNENLQLEEKLAWRRITADQSAAMAAALTPFAGTKIYLLSEGNGDPEVDGFLGQLTNTMRTAGWKVTIYDGNEKLPALVGTSCFVDPNNAAAKALVAQLNALPGGCRVMAQPGMMATVAIGIRPPA